MSRIAFLADLCHNMPLAVDRPGRRPARGSGRRPMAWTWNTAGAEGRAWMLEQIEQAGCCWSPPPPLEVPQKGVPHLSPRQRFGPPGTWPVTTPAGRVPLPSEAKVLKALDTEAMCAVYDEAGRLRLGLGAGGPWLPAHLAPDAVHFIVPDPAPYYWPDPDGKIRWWHCRALLHMVDAEQVSAMVAVLPGSFAALPSNVPRAQQRRLVHVIRATKRDTHLWSLDHRAECGPQTCGYTPPSEDTPAETRGTNPPA